MVLESIEFFKGRGTKPFMATPRRVWVKVPDQGHGSEIEQGTGFVPMEVADGVEDAVLVVHQPVQSIAGAVGFRVGEGLLEFRGLVTQPQDLLPHRVDQDAARPLPEPSHTVGELSLPSRHDRCSRPSPRSCSAALFGACTDP